ncbi:alpha/beta fold hydrolase [bacterium]|nr:alpha/beta fold hydrolase [bacterium]
MLVVETFDGVKPEVTHLVSRYVRLNGYRLHYLDEGQGAPILFLHGVPTSSYLYRHLVLDLARNYRCIAPDLPGFGLSEAPDGCRFTFADFERSITDFVKALDLRGITLVVHDFGGPIGLSVATRMPERFSRIVIMNTFAWPLNGDPHFETLSRLVGGAFATRLLPRSKYLVGWFVQSGVKTRRLSRETLAAYGGVFRNGHYRPIRRLVTSEILASRGWLSGLRDRLETIAGRPALICWGDRDPAFRRKECERFERIFPDHRTVHLKNAGHFVPEDAHARVSEEIHDWLSATPHTRRRRAASVA